MDKMKIEIWSDIACPFCYIGKRKMEMALNKFEHRNEIEFVWHSYELDPSLPKEGIDKSFYDYLAQKYDMPLEGTKQQQKEVIRIAKEVGLNYNFDKLVITNTSDALRLSALAAKSGLADEAKEALFEAHFIDAKNVGDRSILIEIGTKIGLKENDIIAMLDGNDFKDKIEKDKERAEAEFDLQYIPFYRLNYNQIIQGSIEVADYLKAIRQAYADWKSGVQSDGEIISGQSCSIDGVCS